MKRDIYSRTNDELCDYYSLCEENGKKYYAYFREKNNMKLQKQRKNSEKHSKKTKKGKY